MNDKLNLSDKQIETFAKSETDRQLKNQPKAFQSQKYVFKYAFELGMKMYRYLESIKKEETQ